MLTSQDLEDLKKRGITAENFSALFARFTTGFPYLRLSSSATVDGGSIMRLTPEQEQQAIERWKLYLASDNAEVTKFVPASGAASRMFKALYAFVDGTEDIPDEKSPVRAIIDNLAKLPFIGNLDDTLRHIYGADSAELCTQGRYKDIIRAIVSEDGMGYGSLPKALLTFHRYADGSTRTPLEEQLAEGAQTATAGGFVRLHFTVSHNHRELFAHKISTSAPAMAEKYNVSYDISMSEQKPSTDTPAANADNTPFRDAQGHIVFRPGGHGALIANLNDIDSTIVFIKNIDNVVPDSLRAPTIRYKQVIAGVLMQARDSINKYIRQLRSGKYTIDDLHHMIAYMHDTLNIRHEDMKRYSDKEMALYLLKKFDRPLRVCGMVKNLGEPGGGPYIAYSADGSTAPQILESSQIDQKNPEARAMMATATHFNPVDLVCCIKDANGRHYDLPQHVDPATGFISSKSLDGRELKAMELPGLWNGAMSDWNTIFVEVPIETFNPVKTINDLLRPQHQA